MSRHSLEDRIKAIEYRNAKVERDKAWETSMLRRSVITGLTYIIVLIYLLLTDVEKPALTAVVPALGYFLSTLVITSLKQRWMNKS